MNRDIINKAIENPELLLQLSVDELEKISRQYPYFSAAKVLLSKSYRQSNDHRYADQMVQAALYTGNRNALFNWLKEPVKIEEKVEPAAAAIPLPVLETVVPKEEILIAAAEPIVAEQKALETAAEVETWPVAVAENELAVAEFSAEVKNLVDLILNEAEPLAEAKAIAAGIEEEQVTPQEKPAIPEWTGPLTAEAKAAPLPMDDMQRQILIDAVQSSIALEVTEDIAEQKQANTEEQEPIDENSFAGWMYKRAQQLHFAQNATSKPENDSEIPELGDWKHLNEDETEGEEEKNSEIEEILNRPETGSLSHPIKRIITTTNVDHQKDLIDKFIRFEPRIARSKSQEYTPGNIAKESLEEDFTFVTETMAILYAKQGRLDKAKKAFKKLMEQHPEKSVYFAAQLKNLDKFKKP